MSNKAARSHRHSCAASPLGWRWSALFPHFPQRDLQIGGVLESPRGIFAQAARNDALQFVREDIDDSS